MELHHLEGRNRASELDKMVENATRASNFLKALAHESRLMIFCILGGGRKIGQRTRGSAPVFVSRRYHSSSRGLRADGLVSTRRDGKAIYYKLASEEARIIIGAIYDVFCRKVRKR